VSSLWERFVRASCSCPVVLAALLWKHGSVKSCRYVFQTGTKRQPGGCRSVGASFRLDKRQRRPCGCDRWIVGCYRYSTGTDFGNPQYQGCGCYWGNSIQSLDGCVKLSAGLTLRSFSPKTIPSGSKLALRFVWSRNSFCHWSWLPPKYLWSGLGMLSTHLPRLKVCPPKSRPPAKVLSAL
jgi:hypothetical protein